LRNYRRYKRIWYPFDMLCNSQ